MKLALNGVTEDLVAVYAADLAAAGLEASARELVWGARVFCSRLGGTDGWQAKPLEEQLAENVKVHRFVAWLAATQRLVLDPDYVVARRVRLGIILTRHFPAFHASFVETARRIGLSEARV